MARTLVPLLAALSLLLLAAPGAHAQTCANADLEPGAGETTRLRGAVLCLVNIERTHRGIHPLRAQRRLQRAATRHSRDMTRRGYFDHVSPGGRTMVERARRAKYLTARISWRLAENIAWGTGFLASPAEVVKSWMHSPGHRRNILDAGLREAGVGIALRTPEGEADGATYTMLYGRRS